MRIRQLALVAHDLDATVSTLCRVLDLEVGFRDPGVALFGLRNAVIPVGDTFLEVVSPVKEGTTAGRLLERRKGDGGYMVILQTDDLDSHRQRLAELGVRIVWEHALEDIATIHLHPKDVGGAILSLDAAEPPESWRWAGPDWESHRRTETTCCLDGVEIQTQAPERTAARWSRIVGAPVVALPSGALEIPLDRGRIRFVEASDGRGDGVSGIDVLVTCVDTVLGNAERAGLVTHDSAFTACGTRFGLREN